MKEKERTMGCVHKETPDSFYNMKSKSKVSFNQCGTSQGKFLPMWGLSSHTLPLEEDFD